MKYRLGGRVVQATNGGQLIVEGCHSGFGTEMEILKLGYTERMRYRRGMLCDMGERPLEVERPDVEERCRSGIVSGSRVTSARGVPEVNRESRTHCQGQRINRFKRPARVRRISWRTKICTDVATFFCLGSRGVSQGTPDMHLGGRQGLQNKSHAH